MDLEAKITNRSAKIAVIGMGYVGFPLSLEYTRAGFDVIGIDIDEKKVESINAGKSHPFSIRKCANIQTLFVIPGCKLRILFYLFG